MDIQKLVLIELAVLKSSIELGDEVVSEVLGNGKLIKYSRKTANARMKFINMIKDMIGTGELTTSEATQATQLFGKKTTKLYWIK